MNNNNFKYYENRKRARQNIDDFGKVNGFGIKKGKPQNLLDEIELDLFNLDDY